MVAMDDCRCCRGRRGGSRSWHRAHTKIRIDAQHHASRCWSRRAWRPHGVVLIWRLGLVGVTLIGAFASHCKTTADNGFGILLTITADTSLSDEALETVAYIEYTTSGDEMETERSYFVRKAFAQRRERVVFRPRSSTRIVAIGVVAFDGSGTAIGDGSTG